MAIVYAYMNYVMRELDTTWISIPHIKVAIDGTNLDS